MKKTFTAIKSLYSCFLGIFLLISFLETTVVCAQSISVEPESFQVDKSRKLIVCNRIPAIPPGQPARPKIMFDKEYTFSEATAAFEKGKAYKINNNGAIFTLFFTGLPILNVKTVNSKAINEKEDDVRTPGTITLSTADKPLVTSYMGIRVRGNFSRGYPKKGYNMELWNDIKGDESRDVSLDGLREDSDYYLLAMYGESMRLQNATAHSLWLKTHTLPYIAKEPEAIGGIRFRYTDVFINGSYNGVYLLTEKEDRKQLKLKKITDDGEVRGELYKTNPGSATKYTGPLPSYDPNAGLSWGGFEIDYPKQSFWFNLYDFVNFIVNSSNQNFKAGIFNRVEITSLIDNFVFINAIRAADNMSNNQVLAKYKEGEKYFYLPWDLDASFGYDFTGNKEYHTNDVMTNGLYNRLLSQDPDGFKSKLRKRWFELRGTIYSLESIKQELRTHYNLLQNEGAYARETLRWPDRLALADFSYIDPWLEKRLAFLDKYFGAFPADAPAPFVVTLTSFTGAIDGAQKKLDWATSKEQNSRRFEVEFSTNGSSYSKVGEVAAAGTSDGTKTYSFTHSNTSSPAYYRLKMISTSETSQFSSVVQITAPGGCTPPAPPAVNASSTTATSGQSVQLTATGCAYTVVWSTNQTGSPITVNPTITTSYTAKCQKETGCESGSSTAVTVTINNPTTVTGNFEGFLDKVECGTIRGWVWDRNKPNTPLTVEFLEGNTSLGTALADIYREDIKAAGKGDGRHVYSFPTPDNLKDNRTHTISARVLGSTYTLKQAPKVLGPCAPGARLSASFDDESGIQILVAPNPTSGEFEVSFYTATWQQSTVSVVDLLGRNWFTSTLEGSGIQKQKVRLTGATGLYMVQVQQGQDVRTKSLVLQK
ncbi:CotH kinase family protein [Larkinella sp. GY13]|uniref:CotH kinase family protein n=1 Tax=Larkinella sp. GY13 TaxID=3453720 RepID=UPI003EF08AF5